MEDFDIYTSYGKFTAAFHEIDVNISDQQLDIDFVAKTGESCIYAIEIFPKPEEPTAISNEDNQKLLPNRFYMEQNYPNPFNMETRISYQLPVASHVTLEVFNILGQKQKTLVDEEIASGYHSIKWNGLDMKGNPVSSGFYIYQIRIKPNNGQFQSFNETRKMLMLK